MSDRSDPLADALSGDDVYGNAAKGRIQWNPPGAGGASPHPSESNDVRPDDADSRGGETSAERRPPSLAGLDMPAGTPDGPTRSHDVLQRLVESGHPALVADAIDLYLRRLALLELLIEERGLDLEESELADFLGTHREAVDDATYQLAQLLFGRVASREGG